MENHSTLLHSTLANISPSDVSPISPQPSISSKFIICVLMICKCAALSCPTSSERNLFNLFKFPKNQQLRIIWNKCLQDTNNDDYPGEEKYLCELHFDENQWEDSSRKHLISSAIPTISLQFRQKDYVKNVCHVLQSAYQDENLPSKFVHILDHISCIEKETENEAQKLLKELGKRLVEFGLQKARVQRKEKLLLLIAEKNEIYKTELKNIGLNN